MERVVTTVSGTAGESTANTAAHGARKATEYFFGPFRFIPARRTLLCGEVPLRIGGRAIDILAILLERAGEPIGKRELIARAWPTTVVEDGNLKVHVAALRRALVEFEGGAHYIATVNGRGYCFVAPVHASAMPAPEPALPRLVPPRPARQSTGQEAMPVLLDLPRKRRFAGIVGPCTIAGANGDQHAQDIDPERTSAAKLQELIATHRAAHGPAIEGAPVVRDAAQASIAHVAKQIGALQKAVEVLETARDRDRLELQSVRAQLEAALRQPAAHDAWADGLRGGASSRRYS